MKTENDVETDQKKKKKKNEWTQQEPWRPYLILLHFSIPNTEIREEEI